MGYAEEIAHFVDCVRTRATPITSADDQLATLRVVYAAYQSAATGSAVSLAAATA